MACHRNCTAVFGTFNPYWTDTVQDPAGEILSHSGDTLTHLLASKGSKPSYWKLKPYDKNFLLVLSDTRCTLCRIVSGYLAYRGVGS